MVKYILLKITINFKGLAINQPKITSSFSKAYLCGLQLKLCLNSNTQTLSIIELLQICGCLSKIQVPSAQGLYKKRNL